MSLTYQLAAHAGPLVRSTSMGPTQSTATPYKSSDVLLQDTHRFSGFGRQESSDALLQDTSRLQDVPGPWGQQARGRALAVAATPVTVTHASQWFCSDSPRRAVEFGHSKAPLLLAPLLQRPTLTSAPRGGIEPNPQVRTEGAKVSLGELLLVVLKLVGNAASRLRQDYARRQLGETVPGRLRQACCPED